MVTDGCLTAQKFRISQRPNGARSSRYAWISIIHDPENSAELREKGSYDRRENCQAGSGGWQIFVQCTEIVQSDSESD